MSRRSILSATERESLLALPDAKDDLIRYYTFSETDLSVIRQRRGPANRLGFAVQLCYLRFPGVILGADEPPFPPLLRIVASQLKVPVESWDDYGQREQTRREHLVELQTVFGLHGNHRQSGTRLSGVAHRGHFRRIQVHALRRSGCRRLAARGAVAHRHCCGGVRAFVRPAASPTAPPLIAAITSAMFTRGCNF
jgi:TnpA family transposase